MEYLPSDVTINIISRLPAESIYHCKQVCKAWRRLITCDKLFALTYQRRLYEQNNSSDAASGKMSLMFSSSRSGYLYNQFCYAKYDPYEHFMEYIRINLLPRDYSKCYRIIGSCNGLVCISHYKESNMDESIYICNPVTKEYLLLPSLSDTILGSNNRFDSGFGYISSTNEYKVVKIHCTDDDIDAGFCTGYFQKRVYVYTLGSGEGWRCSSKITYYLTTSHPCVFVNGALYWVDYRKGNIVAFDLAQEKFSMVSLTPPCFINNWPLDSNFSGYQLQCLGGSLCIVHKHNDFVYDTWSLKKGSKGYEDYHWVRDIKTFESGRYANILAVTKDDEFLVLDSNRNTFYRHDSEKIRDSKHECVLDFEKYFDLNVGDALLHVNSFVSLTALGEEDTKTYANELITKHKWVQVRIDGRRGPD